MNKYQQFILENGRGCISTDLNFNENKCISEFVEDDKFFINQDNNYNIKKHNLLLISSAIESIEIDGEKYDQNTIEFECKEPHIIVPLDFDKRASKITFNFLNSMADPLTLNLDYKEADHTIYDSKIQAEINALIKPEHRTGINLVNIYWDAVSDKVEEINIILYSVTKETERLIAKYKQNEKIFKSITGLAFGDYKYEIVEFDKNGNELARTEKISFTLEKSICRGDGGYSPVVIR